MDILRWVSRGLFGVPFNESRMGQSRIGHLGEGV